MATPDRAGHAARGRVLQKDRLRGQRHGPQSNVRHAGLRPHPHSRGLVGGELPHFVVRQVALPGEVLITIARGAFGVDASQPVWRAIPHRPVGCYRVGGCARLFQCRGNPWVIPASRRFETFAAARSAGPVQRPGIPPRRPPNPACCGSVASLCFSTPVVGRDSSPAANVHVGQRVLEAPRRPGGPPHTHGFFKYLSNQFISSHNTCSMDSRPP